LVVSSNVSGAADFDGAAVPVVPVAADGAFAAPSVAGASSSVRILSMSATSLAQVFLGLDEGFVAVALGAGLAAAAFSNEFR
jgi:hypothetical protein